VDYIALAKAGRISTDNAVADIAEAYNVARRTVHDWVKSIPAAPNVNEAAPEFVMDRALAGAERYRVGGSSKAAVTSRNSKRRSRI
jgi:hypothetical protein